MSTADVILNGCLAGAIGGTTVLTLLWTVDYIRAVRSDRRRARAAKPEQQK